MIRITVGLTADNDTTDSRLVLLEAKIQKYLQDYIETVNENRSDEETVILLNNMIIDHGYEKHSIEWRKEDDL